MGGCYILMALQEIWVIRKFLATREIPQRRQGIRYRPVKKRSKVKFQTALTSRTMWPLVFQRFLIKVLPDFRLIISIQLMAQLPREMWQLTCFEIVLNFMESIVLTTGHSRSIA